MQFDTADTYILLLREILYNGYYRAKNGREGNNNITTHFYKCYIIIGLICVSGVSLIYDKNN